jgi:hypothetical protein
VLHTIDTQAVWRFVTDSVLKAELNFLFFFESWLGQFDD